MSALDSRDIARERVERYQSVDARGFGGRRIGLESDEERAKLMELEKQLLELARRAISRSSRAQHGERGVLVGQQAVRQ